VVHGSSSEAFVVRYFKSKKNPDAKLFASGFLYFLLKRITVLEE